MKKKDFNKIQDLRAKMAKTVKEKEKDNDNLLLGCRELFNRLDSNEKKNLINNESIFKNIFKNILYKWAKLY